MNNESQDRNRSRRHRWRIVYPRTAEQLRRIEREIARHADALAEGRERPVFANSHSHPINEQ